MIPYNNFSVLPWYTSIEEQNARKWWAYGRVYPLFTPGGYVPPFQLIVPHVNTPSLSSFILKDANNGITIGDFTSQLSSAGLTFKQFTTRGYDVVVYPSTQQVLTNVKDGRYYFEAMINGVKHYSEVFTLVNNMSGYVKLQWWDVEDFVMDGGTIVYKTPAFKNVLYIDSDIAKPEYLFEEEGETRDGYYYPFKMISEKRYHFQFLASEYLLDVMRFIRMSDYVEIIYKGQTFSVDTFLMTPEWEGDGDIASVEVEFETSTVAKRLPYIEDITPTPLDSLSVTPTSLTFAAEGETLAINIVSNVPWVLSLPSWLVASAQSGSGNATINLTAGANNTGSQRTGYVSVVGDGVQGTNVSVLQPTPSSKYLSASPMNIQFAPEGGTATLAISSNVAWSLTLPNWISASAQSGQNNASITLTASANSSGSSRSGNIVIAGTDVSSVNVATSQAAQFSPSISINRPTFESDYKERTFYFQITCNGAWECVSSTAAWLTCSSSGNGNGTATIHLDANSSSSQRSGTLTFRMVDYPSVTCTSTITQGAYEPTITYSIELDPAYWTFDRYGETLSVGVEGITRTDGVVTARTYLNASALTFSSSGDSVATRSGLSFTAPNITSLPYQDYTHQTWHIVWTAHPSASANLNLTQMPNYTGFPQWILTTISPTQFDLYDVNSNPPYLIYKLHEASNLVYIDIESDASEYLGANVFDDDGMTQADVIGTITQVGPIGTT